MPSDNSTPPCHPQACAIQTCLQRTGTFDQSKCEHLVDELYRCCARFYKGKGDKAESDSCPMPSVVERRIKRMEKEGKGGEGGTALETRRR